MLADGPATAPPAGALPGGGLLVNVSRGIARAALDDLRTTVREGVGRPLARGITDPGERLAAAAAEWAETPRCATLTPSRDGFGPPRSHTRSIHKMPFNIGPGELIIVLVIALIVVGPGKLPDVGAALGKSIKEFRKAATDVKDATSLDGSGPGRPSQPPSPRPPRSPRRSSRRRRPT